MEEKTNNTSNSKPDLPKEIENPYARKYRQAQKSKRKIKLGDYLAKRGLSILGSLFILIGIMLMVINKLPFIYSFFGIQEKATNFSFEIPSFSLFFNFTYGYRFYLFVIGLIIVGITFFTSKRLTLSRILALLGLATIYYSLYFFIINWLLNIYTSVFLILFITILGIFSSMRLKHYMISLFTVVMNFISFFLLYYDQYYIIIFPFMTILNLIYAYPAIKKNWHIIITTTTFLTLIFFGFLITRKIVLFDLNIYPPYSFLMNSLVCLTLILILFIYTYKNKEDFGVIDYINYTAVVAFYSVFGILILSKLGFNEYQGVFSLVSGILFMLMFFFFRKNLYPSYMYLFLGFSILLFSIVLPLQVKYFPFLFFMITFSVLVVWFARLQENKTYVWISIGSVLFIFISYMISMIEGLIAEIFSIETGFLDTNISRCSFSGFFIAASLLSSYYLLHKNKKIFIDNKGYLVYGLKYKKYTRVLKLGAYIILYPSIYYYINYLFKSYTQLEILNQQAWYAFTLVYLIFLIIYTNLNKEKGLKATLIVFSFIFCLLYPFLIHDDTVIIRDSIIKSNEGRYGFFYFHYIIIAFILVLLIMVHNFLNKKFSTNSFVMNITYILLAMLGIYIITTEYNHISVFLKCNSYSDMDAVLNISRTIGVTIVWVLCSFIMIYLSIKFHLAIFRTLSLLMVFFTAVKIFAYDIDRVTQDTLNIIFIIFGALLLVLSVTYRRLRKVIYSKNPPHRHAHH